MSARARTASVSFRARGHAGIAGTHDKTLEFTRDRDVTRRATCVLGVDADYDDAALLRLRGEVEVTLDAGDLRDEFSAIVTPFYIGDDSIVFRRGPALRGRTFAGDASKSAATIDRALVRVLADPGVEMRVTVRETGRGAPGGALFVVSVPIGNDDDLSPRARRVLGAADIVLAEDTRQFRDLVRRADIVTDAVVVSYHDHNEQARADDVVDRLRAGARVALVSDAGTPLFSDPGYVVVHRAVEAGIAVTPVPGPSSFLAVLSASGLAVDRFTYVGFLARRSAARQTELRDLAERGMTFVVHEAPHRVAALLADIHAVCPDWQVCAGREVTKVFEEFQWGTASELAGLLALDEPRGEFTFVVSPPATATDAGSVLDDERLDRLVRALVQEGVTTKTLAAALAHLPGISRKEAYARILALAESR